MKEENNNKKGISRKEFLRLSGSILAGGAIAGISGKLIHDMIRRPEKVFFDADGEEYDITDGDDSVSPYRKISSFRTPEEIEAFDLMGGRMVAVGDNSLSVYSPEGNVEECFAVGSDVRDICVVGQEIYVLFPARIEVYSPSGELLREWDACSDNSDYCSFTVTPQSVFVTDAFAKNICQYDLEGGLKRFIDSPNGFVVPSYSFAITNHDGTVYCSNPGRHLVESYTEEGKYLASFGQAGTAVGAFSGCCNPVQLSFSPAGELLTSEKGIPRISCYSPDGTFRSVLLNKKALGGGYDAFEARMTSDGRIVAAGKHSVAVYKYDSALAKASKGGSAACEVCGISDCPIRRGITV
ncbi:MAG: hypothetical protein IJ202_06725 [Bacteroidales bacterium]|nr:hypothetical protein [Bacteroidales bacterium]